MTIAARHFLRGLCLAAAMSVAHRHHDRSGTLHVMGCRADAADGGPAAGFSGRRPILVLIACIAFIFSIWVLYGSGAEVVFWGFLVLVAGIPICTWRKWRSGAATAKTGSRVSVSHIFWGDVV